MGSRANFTPTEISLFSDGFSPPGVSEKGGIHLGRNCHQLSFKYSTNDKSTPQTHILLLADTTNHRSDGCFGLTDWCARARRFDYNQRSRKLVSYYGRFWLYSTLSIAGERRKYNIAKQRWTCLYIFYVADSRDTFVWPTVAWHMFGHHFGFGGFVQAQRCRTSSRQ